MIQHVVQIIDWETNKVQKEFDPTSKGRAERIEDGVNINLNHDKFYTKIVEREVAE